MQKMFNSASHIEGYVSSLFDNVVETIVNVLEFRVAMFAVHERVGEENRIVVKAFSAQLLRNKVFKEILLSFGEVIAGRKLIGSYVVINDPDTQGINQAVQAIVQNKPFAVTTNLYDLFAPLVNPTICRLIQNRAGVRTMVTVPFRNSDNELLGNLYAGSDESALPQHRIDQLRGFTQLATVAIEASHMALQNAQYARDAERMAMLASGVGNNTHKLNNLLGNAGSSLFMEIVKILNQLTQVLATVDIPNKDQILALSQDIWTKELTILDDTMLQMLADSIAQLPDAVRLELALMPSDILPLLLRTTQQVRSANNLILNVAQEARRYSELAKQHEHLSTSELERPIANVNQAIVQVIESLRSTDKDIPFPNLDDYVVPAGIRFEHPNGEVPIMVMCNATHLQEILRVLMKNACQAMSHNGVLRVYAHYGDGDVVITVEDNGAGIPVEVRHRLFEFKESSKIGGLGYGLWYVALTLKKYGGSIEFHTVTEAEATPDMPMGTTFTIRLLSA